MFQDVNAKKINVNTLKQIVKNGGIEAHSIQIILNYYNNLLTHIAENPKLPMLAQPRDPQLIKKRDYTLIIDKSPSMNLIYENPLLTEEEQRERAKSRWEEMQEATSSFVTVLQKYDPDGITVYSFATTFKKYEDIRSEAQVKEIFIKHPSGGGTRLDLVLKDALDHYFDNKNEILKKKTGETILVVTDGEADFKERVVELIVDATRRISRDEELAISFIQIGSDSKATTFLKQLDDELESTRQAIFDIVDVKTYDDFLKEELTLEQILIDAICNKRS